MNKEIIGNVKSSGYEPVLSLHKSCDAQKGPLRRSAALFTKNKWKMKKTEGKKPIKTQGKYKRGEY